MARTDGECDICGKFGGWEVGIFDDPEEAKKRPLGCAAFFPNKKIPAEWKGMAWSSPEFCQKNDVYIRLACPNCWR